MATQGPWQRLEAMYTRVEYYPWIETTRSMLQDRERGAKKKRETGCRNPMRVSPMRSPSFVRSHEIRANKERSIDSQRGQRQLPRT